MAKRKHNYATTKLFRKLRAEGCCACGSMQNTEVHHIKTRGSGGTDHANNCIPLCAGCHTGEPYSWHKNKKLFLRTFPHVWTRMEQKMGWRKYHGKLVPPIEAVGLTQARQLAGDTLTRLSATIGEALERK